MMPRSQWGWCAHPGLSQVTAVQDACTLARGRFLVLFIEGQPSSEGWGDVGLIGRKYENQRAEFRLL